MCCLFLSGRHARIQEFSSGGVQVSLTKKALTFFLFFLSPQLILQKSNGQFQRNLNIFQGSRGGPTFSRGGGGVQLLIPYRNPYNLWFSRGGPDPLSNPSGSALGRFTQDWKKSDMYIPMKQHKNGLSFKMLHVQNQIFLES